MKIRKIDDSNLEEAISLVARLNQDLNHKISYFGETREEIEADFSTVQPPEGYSYIAISDQGKVIGFFGIEMDLDLGRSWQLGPLVEEQDWDAIAEQLYQALKSQTRSCISTARMYGSRNLHYGMGLPITRKARFCSWM